VTGSFQLVVPFNDRRIGLVISQDNSSSIGLSFRKQSTPIAESILLAQNQPPLFFNERDNGDACHGPWFARPVTATTVVTYLETIGEAP
jgi:hypothetical protein